MGTHDLLGKLPASDDSRMSHDSTFSGSTASLVLENIDLNRVKDRGSQRRSKPLPPLPRSNNTPYSDYADNLSDFDDDDPLKEGNDDLETGPFLRRGAVATAPAGKRMDRSTKRVIIAISVAIITVWVVGLFVYISSKSYKNPSDVAHDPQATVSRGHGKPISLEELSQYTWSPTYKSVEWIAGPKGEDGLVLTADATGKDYLTVLDVRSQDPQYAAGQTVVVTKTLMKTQSFHYKGETVHAETSVPSKNMLKVLVASDREKVWRHSSLHRYWVFDVATQSGEPLVPNEPDAHIQIALWSPTNDAIVFVRENNLYLRSIPDQKVTQITKDGGKNIFYGVPDWVYEEEVFNADKATWWSDDGKYIAFLRTNESEVMDFDIQYYVSSPSGKKPEPGKGGYPETVPIKYPKAGSPNPVVDLQFYDVEKGDVFSVDISGGFADDDRLITNVIWMGKDVLIKESNRVSDVLRVVLVDVGSRTGETVRSVDLDKLDGGWFEISKKTTYVPADPKNGRPNDGYVDQVVTDGYDHLAYFTPPNSDKPIILTKGEWEVVDAPDSVDLARNLVYFVATKDGSVQRHVYSVKLDGTGIAPITDTTTDGYYGVSFSAGGGYALLSYQGPNVPYQKVISTPANEDKFEHTIQENKGLERKAREHEMPILNYGTINVDGVDLNYVERRPPHFNEKKKYPVLFFQYSGPGSQEVTKKFAVDFQSYVASALGYVVVTVDGRGTGFLGRKNRVLIRGKLGQWEAKDQIAAGKHWAALPYIDASRIAIWGWSYGGFQTLKTLEMDAGKTFSYGMAVAPVTDWRFYDSIYTERYMRTPETNPEGYAQSAIANATALGESVRFLIMHGTGDDNVHFQNSLQLLDKLDVANVVNYDVHVFPDSDHGIYLHNARTIVNQKLSDWLVNAFNGQWLKTAHPKPVDNRKAKRSP